MVMYEMQYIELPKCLLLDRLYNESLKRYDIDFDFLGIINQIRQRVSMEVAQINRLFPEYTPHDEKYHIKRLFSVADVILGDALIERMNSTELLVLACSLYCHDWGMAVSEHEKELIISLNENKQGVNNNLWIIDNEKVVFNQFLKKHGIKQDKDITEIPIEIWRSYVRETHALRSGTRALRFFEEIDNGLANAVSKVSIGHGLDFKDVRKYPSDSTVLNETINLRAIAIYVRLIDLLDITGYRTPYIIWKYVSPKNPFSKMEWDKHRAIHSVSPADYLSGRVIHVDGSTENHEVYAALEDLKTWCDEQLRGCKDLLAEMNDNRHTLDIYHIDWRIETKGFIPSKIRFEFDRGKMFEILSEEIYQNDPYVFLRELLQNSIDAIRMRRAYLKDKGLEISNIGLIKVDIEHQEDANAIIIWSDDGIGMNEHIIRNYLAVAGKSYYGSDEFKNESLNLDPISRFGVGILSCFGVSDQIDIETRRDPYIELSDKLLKITIPSVTNHFRCEQEICTSNFIGTKIRVFVDGKKIRKIAESNIIDKLDVTRYLTLVAGFVEFPIMINEGDRRTIILHPRSNEEANNYGKEYVYHKLSFGYSWNDTFLPQDIDESKKVFREKSIEISSLPLGHNYDGRITLLAPKHEIIDFEEGYSYDYHTISAIYRDNKQLNNAQEIRVKWRRSWNDDTLRICNSCKVSPYYSVYRDGILVSGALEPQLFNQEYSINNEIMLKPRIVVNIPKSSSEKIDLARMHIMGESEQWDKPIKKQYVKSILDEANLINVDTFTRLLEMAKIVLYYNINVRELWDNFSTENWPVLLLDKGGEIRCLDWREIGEEVIYTTPSFIDYDISNILLNKIYKNKSNNNILKKWIGEKSLIISSDSHFIKKPLSFEYLGKIANYPLERLYNVVSLRFITSPLIKGTPIIQRIWEQKAAYDDMIDEEILYKKAINNPIELSKAEKTYISRDTEYFKFKYHIPEIYDFEEPFNESAAYGWDIVNFVHPLGQALIKIISFLKLEELNPSMNQEQFGHFTDYLRKIPYYEEEILVSKLFDALNDLFSNVAEHGIVNIEDINLIIPKTSEFIPGTVIIKRGKEFLVGSAQLEEMKKCNTDFGKVISSID